MDLRQRSTKFIFVIAYTLYNPESEGVNAIAPEVSRSFIFDIPVNNVWIAG